MKYLVILPGALPFPPLMGGATENLVRYYVDDNEKNKRNNFIVISSYNQIIKDYRKKYKYCKLLYINQDKIAFKFKKMIIYLMRRYFKLKIPNAYLATVLKMIKHEEFDRIIVENNPEFGYYLRKKYKDKKIYLHLHNDSVNQNNISWTRSYDRIICVSNFIKNRINSLDKNLDVVTLYNAIELNKYVDLKDKKNAVYKKYGISSSKKIVMYVGRIQENKGVLDLISAFKKCNKDKSLQLVIVGGTFFKNSKPDNFYKKINDNIKEDDSIILTGYVDYNKIPEIMHCADIGVVPSKCNEAFGLTLLEFMAVGKPTIITNDGALTEIGDFNTSIIIEDCNDNSKKIEQALIKLTKNTSEFEIRKMKANALEKAKKYSVGNYVKKFNEYVGD